MHVCNNRRQAVNSRSFSLFELSELNRTTKPQNSPMARLVRRRWGYSAEAARAVCEAWGYDGGASNE